MIDKSKTVFAVLDMQGFYVRNKFVPREIALVDEDICASQDIDTELCVHKLELDDIVRCAFLSKYFHALSLRPVDTSLKLTDALTLLRDYQNECSTPESPFYGVKNHMLEKLLVENNIKCIDLSTLGCRSYAYPEKSASNCLSHEK
jgi:hypothetical protein